MPITLPNAEATTDRRLQASSVHAVARQCAALLPDDDQIILRLLQADPPSSLRQVAALINLNPGSLSRRVARIRRRMNHPVVVSLATRGHTLSDRFFNIARALFAAGRPVRAVARAFNAEDREISAIRQYLHGWSKSDSRRSDFRSESRSEFTL